MKKYIIITILIFGYIYLSLDYTFCKSVQTNKKEINCDSIPELNKQVISFVKSKINKKVGKGECWDLASEALKSINASWDGKTEFGKEVFYKNECIYPGDIIQFNKVKVMYKKDGATYKEKMMHHTAIIYEVNGNGEYTLAHQNTSFSGRKVGLSQLDVKHITKGHIKIFRPIK